MSFMRVIVLGAVGLFVYLRFRTELDSTINASLRSRATDVAALVKEADGWKVDDIASLGEGENWLLSWLLQYDPFAIR